LFDKFKSNNSNKFLPNLEVRRAVSGYFLELNKWILNSKCPALGIWVGFLKQPALPGEAPQKNKKIKNKNH
jgi:hypothetical protein